MDLQEYRRQLNEIDDAMVTLLHRRMKIVQEIGQWKRQQGLPVLDRSREESVLQRLSARYPEEEVEIRRLYETMFEISRNRQEDIPREPVPVQLDLFGEVEVAEVELPYGLLGHPLQHSQSPLIHSYLADYKYDLFDVAPQGFEKFMMDGNFKGLNVTIPYKQKVIAFCQELSPLAQKLQAVNTLIRREDGTLYGDNTDFAGLVYTLERNQWNLQGRKILILGTGATSRTVHAVAEDFKAREIVHVSRRGPVTYENLCEQADAEFIINATPVGMFPHNGEGLIDLNQFPNCIGVLDLIYHPQATALLLQAKELGIPHQNGLAMLVAQAKTAAELFTGRSIPSIIIEEILQRMQKDLTNIILIGMPGSGKTSLGQILAEHLQRPFFDSDALITEEQGCSPDRLIEERGEEGFREVEAELIQRLGKNTGCIIATGGGAVLRQENRQALQQNGWFVWLQRDIEQLSVENRPLSGSIEELLQLYEFRSVQYRALANFAVENQGSLEEIAQKIQEAYDEYFSAQWS